MRLATFIFFLVSLPPVSQADDALQFFTPHGLDPQAITKRFISEDTKPHSMFAELAATEVVRSYALLFRASVDGRPLVVEECFVCAETVLPDQRREWWLMRFCRHPYGPMAGHAEWSLCLQEGAHSEFTLRRLSEKPSNKAIEDFLAWATWTGRDFHGFKDISYLCFYKDWKSLVGAEPIELEGSLPWPPKDFPPLRPLPPLPPLAPLPKD